VRQQIARELTALRAVRQPDTVGVLSRLASAEETAAHLPIKGVLAAERHTTDRAALPEGMLARAWAMTSADGMSNDRLRTKADLLGLAPAVCWIFLAMYRLSPCDRTG